MSADPAPAVDRPHAHWLLYIVVAMLACSIAAYFLDLRLYTHLLGFRWGPKAEVPLMNLRGNDLAEAEGQLASSSRWGGSIALGAIAGALALGLCLADAVSLRKGAAFALSPVGMLVGAAGGAAGGYLATHMHQRFEMTTGPGLTMTQGIMLQTAAWLCAGLGVALGVWISSLGRRSLVDTLFGGLLAGLLVGIVYPPLVSQFYPNVNTDRLFPDVGYFNTTAVPFKNFAFEFWAIVPGALFALVLGLLGRRHPKIESAPAPAAE